MTLFRELKFKKMKSKIQKRSLWIVLGFFAWLTEASAQSYYPGGLGNSNLVVWLNAKKTGSITQNGSNQVSQWADLSGNGYNFIQGTTSEEPVYGAAASPSGMSALTFTSTSTQYLSTPSLPASIVFTAGVSAFAVASYNADQTAQGWQRIFDFGNGAASNNFMMGRDGNSQNTYYEGWKGGAGDQTWTTTNPIVNGSENIYEAGGRCGNAYQRSALSGRHGSGGDRSSRFKPNVGACGHRKDFQLYWPEQLECR